jgi:diguanylate cyclase (GGDEF)-like protein
MSVIRKALASPARLFAIFSAMTVIPVLALGLLLANGLRAEARNRGISEGQAEASLLARTAIEPLLDGRPLSRGISAAEVAQLRLMVKRATGQGRVLRLRLRDLTGRVVFSDDGSGLRERPEDEALASARGKTIAVLTRLNADANDTGKAGIPAVEVYLPLDAGIRAGRVGVLEVYLPYAPISRDLASGLSSLYRDLAIGLGGLYLVLSAITAIVSGRLRREAARTAHLAEYDSLTGLPNRALFHCRLREALDGGAADDAGIVVATVDLDRFKDVNDALGHGNGDRVLTELARRLALEVRPGETVARLGGDEFGLILRAEPDSEARLRRLRTVLEGEIDVAGLALSAEASFGFAIAPEDGADVDTLMRRADVAMYAGKARHRGVLRYRPSHDCHDAERLSLVADLRHAIENDQLVLHYQPQEQLPGGEVVAIEALVRWEHPALGLLYPDKFLPLAEQTELIDRLTAWVLRRALRDLREIAPDETLSVAVNVSARSLGQPALGDDVIEALRETRIAPQRLILEVTETAILADPERAIAVLGGLSAAGVRISLDDFGRGQTSLGYLSALPLDELKIDRSFVGDMLEDRAHAAIVRSVIDLGHNLLLRVVAEGVESDGVLTALREAGCDIAQGYALGRPMSLEHLRARLPMASRGFRPPATELGGADSSPQATGSVAAGRP